MSDFRTVAMITHSKPTLEGAGVHLKRAFGFGDTRRFDPFLLLDDFRSDVPEHYLKGFPWHPHRGIETITYVLKGEVEHGDSLGNRGVISAGDVQWMTAGSGIIHQEMPRGDAQGRMHGFQLWANLPARHKMMPPRYRDITHAQIPLIEGAGGARIGVICGEVDGVRGPADDIIIDPQYLDVCLPAGGEFVHPVPAGYTALAYVIAGRGRFAPDGQAAGNEELVLLVDGSRIRVTAESEGVRFLLLSGKPLGEPVAWYGPIVMNSDEELRVAFAELQAGTFIKS